MSTATADGGEADPPETVANDVPPPATDDPAPRRRRIWPFWLIGGVGAGLIVGRLIPPPYPDGQWWATYVTSPGFGGTAAVIGGTAAAAVAWNNSRRDRQARQLADQRSQWWERFTWAIEKAIDPDTSVVGMKVLDRLVEPGLATVDDATIALEVLEVVAPADEDEAVI